MKHPEDSGNSDTEDTIRAMGFPIDKSLEVGKNEKELVLRKGIYRGKKVLYVANFDTNYLKKMLTLSGIDRKTKDAIKQFFKQRQPPKWFENDLDNEEEESHSKKTSQGPVDKESTQPVKTPPAASRTPVTSCTYILTSGVRKGKQCKLKASDKTVKFCHLHKR